MRKIVVLGLLTSVFLLSGCTSTGKDINNLAININEDFSGSMETVPFEPVYLEWDSKDLTEKEKYLVQIVFPNGFGPGESYGDEQTIEKFSTLLTTEDDQNRLKLQVSWNDTSLFYFFASAKSGDKAQFTLKKISDTGKIISQGNLEWIRPERTGKPAVPVLQNLWTGGSDGYYKYNVSDKSVLTYKTFPDTSINRCIGPCQQTSETQSRFPLGNRIWRWSVKGQGKKVVLERTVSNEKGKSDTAILEIMSNADSVYTSPEKSNPFDRTWSVNEKDQELLAKTAWCIEQGFRNYSYSNDKCTNKISR